MTITQNSRDQELKHALEAELDWTPAVNATRIGVAMLTAPLVSEDHACAGTGASLVHPPPSAVCGSVRRWSIA